MKFHIKRHRKLYVAMLLVSCYMCYRGAVISTRYRAGIPNWLQASLRNTSAFTAHMSERNHFNNKGSLNMTLDEIKKLARNRTRENYMDSSMDEQLKYFIQKEGYISDEELEKMLQRDDASPLEKYYKIYDNKTGRYMLDGPGIRWKINKNASTSDELPEYPELLLYNEKLCESDKPFHLTIMYIYSGITKRDSRDFVRQSYGSPEVRDTWNIKMMFVMGLNASTGATSRSVPKELIEEHQLHNDLLIGDFNDFYRNLFWKGLAAFNFITHYCKNAYFVIKTDDDVIVNVNLLMNWLTRGPKLPTRSMYGKYFPSFSPVWCPNPPLKWCITREQYPFDVYPRYFTGIGIAFTADVMEDLYRASRKVPPFPIDDVYITGLLGTKMHRVRMVNWRKYLEFFHWKAVSRCVNTSPSTMPLVFAHLGTVRNMKMCWEILKDSTPEKRAFSEVVYVI